MMRKLTAATSIVVVLILFFLGARVSNVQAGFPLQSGPGSGAAGVIKTPTGDRSLLQNGAPQSEGGSYLANPLPAPPKDDTGTVFGADAAGAPSAALDECYEYIVNPGFESDGGWYGQPSSNVGIETGSWFTGARSAFLNTNFYSNSALWQTVRVPQNTNAAGLAFYSALAFADPGDIIYITIYDETFSELIFWSYLTYTQIGAWKHFAVSLPVALLAGRTVQLTFQMEEDYDGFYTEMVLDDVSLILCNATAGGPPTATPAPTNTPPPTSAPPTPTPTATPTLLPTNTPIATSAPATPAPGDDIDLTLLGLQVGQTLMANADPVTGATVPLIAGKPALARVYVDVSGADVVDNLDATLFMRDASKKQQLAPERAALCPRRIQQELVAYRDEPPCVSGCG